MAYNGAGREAVTNMWILTAVTLIFVALRIYTRVWVVRSFGVDDHVYNIAFLLLVCYVSFTTVSAHYGFGQTVSDIPTADDVVSAILFEAIGQTFAVIGMAVAKWSLGLFLLRLVNQSWHKAVIWTAMLLLMGASISTCFVFWLQCTPPAYLFDRRIPDGYCHVDSTPVSMLLCILCVLVDFFFALFPWLFIWKLQMNRREKMVILLSMSLGVIAGACGIKRTLEVPELASADYLRDTVGLIVWSAAEIAVTMICIGIPVCRPLYKTFLDRLNSSIGSGYFKGSSAAAAPLALHTFGGTTMRNNYVKADDFEAPQKDPYSLNSYAGQSTGITKPSAKCCAVATANVPPHNTSEEEILGGSSCWEVGSERRSNQIRITEEYQVTSKRLG
ncbi:uncharacterized protein JN550_004655 [Neoarthrinium moseri]|uniref:uncharacterized protein n=1 Tax=Neoarthrinium moseri TaxID=1658444 RepID=UPI001FDB30C6|nr:uncharacterized protein JN550_004655 [Neoarthrinium moseri]KAI1871210.1 hypothetical protein JN550_004655 [Neoarthrinium moseri]